MTTEVIFRAEMLSSIETMVTDYAAGINARRFAVPAPHPDSIQASVDAAADEGVKQAVPADGPTDGWCDRCGCGNDKAGYAHLNACPAQKTDGAAPKQKRTRKVTQAPDPVAQAASKVDGVPSAEAPVTDSQAQVDNSASAPSVTPAEAKEPETAGDKTGVAAPAPAVVVTFDDMKAKLQAVAAHFGGDEGLETVSAIISKFGARKIKEVPADKYAEIVAECEAVLK